MKTIWLGAVALMAASAANATWTWDNTDKILSDGNWNFTCTVSGKNLTLSAVNAGSGDLDFTNVPTDTDGYKVVNISTRFAGASLTYPTSVVAPDLTSVAQGAFYQNPVIKSFSSLISGNFQRGVFAYCPAFESVSLPNVTSFTQAEVGNTSNRRGTFNGCTSLTSVYLPKLTSICSDLFNGCSALETLDLPACTSVGDSGLASCKKLKTLTLKPDIAYFSVAQLALNNCTSLETISCPAVRMTGQKGLFQNCQKLTMGLEVVLNTAAAFGNNTFRGAAIKTLTISAPNCTRIGAGGTYYDDTNQNALYNCSNLTEVVVSSKVFKEVGYAEFTGCKVLEVLDFSCSTKHISFRANAISLSKSLDVYLAKVPTFVGVNGIKTSSAPSRIHVTFDAVKDEEDFDSATEIAAWKAAVAEYADVFETYKAKRDDVPAGCIGVLRCAKAGSAAANYDYAYVIASFPPAGTVLMLK